jgi:hypothetical protein
VPVPVCPGVLAHGGNQRPAHAAHEAEVVAGVVNAHDVRLEGVYIFVGHRPTIDPAGRRGHSARSVNLDDERDPSCLPVASLRHVQEASLCREHLTGETVDQLGAVRGRLQRP